MSAIGLDLGPSLGALEVGGKTYVLSDVVLQNAVIISTLLLGVLTLQVYMYYSNFPSDPINLKIQVAFVWLCELGQSICGIHALYFMAVTNYGNPQVLLKPPQSFNVGLFLYAPIPPIVQTYFALRVYKFSHKIHILVVSVVISFFIFVGSMASAVETVMMKDVEQYVNQLSWLVTAIAGLRLVNDILITATSIIYLYWRRRDSRFLSTGTLLILDKLTEWTLETCFITGVTNVARTICFWTMKHNYIWIAIVIFESRIFANSFLAALNSRRTLRAMKEDVILIDTGLGHTSAYGQVSASRSQHNPPPPSLSIAVELTRTVITDAPDSGAAQKNDVKAIEA